MTGIKSQFTGRKNRILKDPDMLENHRKKSLETGVQAGLKKRSILGIKVDR
jgi:hypothetical protein